MFGASFYMYLGGIVVLRNISFQELPELDLVNFSEPESEHDRAHWDTFRDKEFMIQFVTRMTKIFWYKTFKLSNILRIFQH